MFGLNQIDIYNSLSSYLLIAFHMTQYQRILLEEDFEVNLIFETRDIEC